MNRNRAHTITEPDRVTMRITELDGILDVVYALQGHSAEFEKLLTEQESLLTSLLALKVVRS